MSDPLYDQAGIANLSIGGVQFQPILPDLWHIPLRDSAYRAFINTPDAGTEDTFSVKIMLADDCSKMRKPGRALFKGTGSWTAHREESGVRFVFRNADSGRVTHDVLLPAQGREILATCARTVFAADVEHRELVNVLHYPVDQLMLMTLLASRKGLIAHAAGVEIDGNGYALCGVSGAGKTTVARQLAAESVRLLSDDRVVLRLQNNGWHIYGTPWPGEGGMALNIGVPLRAIVLLEQGDRTEARRIPAAEGARRLLPVLSIPWFSAKHRDEALAALDRLCRDVPSGAMRFALNAPLLGALQSTSVW